MKIARFAGGIAGMITGAAAVAAAFAFPFAPPRPLLPPLVPVNAPIAPALPGQRFAPAEIAPPSEEAAEMPPQSTGTHVTATLTRARTGTRLVAVWGDPVLWEQAGTTWRPAPDLPRLPGDAPEVVALSEKNGQIVVGTRRDGTWAAQNGTWKPLPRPNAPYDANAQALGAYRGELYAATLNDGLVVRDAHGVWRHIAPPFISTLAPRQLVVWHDVLYVRHGNGMVDTFNGRTWTANVFARLPRPQVFALAASPNDDALFLAQWGGWSQTRDGQKFDFHFPPDLRNVPTTSLLCVKNTLYVGTQGRGLAECDPAASGAVRKWHDERAGITDDWITTLSPLPSGNLVTGTFVSGAFCEPSANLWQPVAGTENDCVTASASTRNAAYICLRRGGVWRINGSGTSALVSPLPEAQCVWPDPANHLLWVGTRTGIVAVAENAGGGSL